MLTLNYMYNCQTLDLESMLNLHWLLLVEASSIDDVLSFTGGKNPVIPNLEFKLLYSHIIIFIMYVLLY